MLFHRIPNSWKRYWPQAHPEDEHNPCNALNNTGRASARVVGTLLTTESGEARPLYSNSHRAAVPAAGISNSQLITYVPHHWLILLPEEAQAFVWSFTLHFGVLRTLQGLTKYTLTISTVWKRGLSFPTCLLLIPPWSKLTEGLKNTSGSSS